MMGELLKLGKYEIIEKTATGGMATIYRARFKGEYGFEKIVALKVMHRHLTEQSQYVDMFVDEGRIGALLNHPSIISTIDFGEIDGYYFLALEFFEGASLAEILKGLWKKKKKKFKRELAISITADVLRALSYAHDLKDPSGKSLKLVHRDISPQNIMISGDGIVKICDFGIAKSHTNRSLTEVHVIKGKIQYMSPEQAGGNRIDARSDLYSVGVVLYEMLAGTHLFEDRNTEKLRKMVIDGVKKENIDSLDHPVELKDFLLQSLAQKPSERFQDAREMLSFLLKIKENVCPDIDCESTSAVLKTLIRRPRKTEKPQIEMNLQAGEHRVKAGEHELKRALVYAKYIAITAGIFLLAAFMFELF
jgi:serine/threonine-protein kinase